MTLTSHSLPLGEGRSLHLVEGGQGRPIVLIHGAVHTHCDWMGSLFDGVSARGRAFAVDRPGHGESLRPRFRASPREQADQIREGLARLGVERPLVVGHSFGGMVALAWAAAYPGETAGLLLLAPIVFQEIRPVEHALFGPRAFPLVGPLVSEVALRTLDPGLLPIVQKLMFSPQPVSPDWLARYPFARILTAAQAVEEGEDVGNLTPGSPGGLIDFAAIQAPVRILTGDRDHIVDHNRHARRLATMLPQAELTVLEGVGHMLQHVESEAVFRALDELLVRIEAPQAAA